MSKREHSEQPFFTEEDCIDQFKNSLITLSRANEKVAPIVAQVSSLRSENENLRSQAKALLEENERLKLENKTGYAVLCVDLAKTEALVRTKDERIAKLEQSIEKMAAHAGHPDAKEGCRLVCVEARAALGEGEKE